MSHFVQAMSKFTAILFACLIGAVLCQTSSEDPCKNVQCKVDETCYFGVCVANMPGFPKLTCEPACHVNEFCDFGKCLLQPVDPFRNATACVPPCDDKTTCIFGQCMPHIDRPCDPVCAATEECIFGMCIPFAPKPCDPACEMGSLCIENKCIIIDPHACPTGIETCPDNQQCVFGHCIAKPVFQDPCDPHCKDGEACMPEPGKEGLHFKCVAINAPCANCTTSGEHCFFGQCQECKICSELDSVFTTALGQLQVNIDKFDHAISEALKNGENLEISNQTFVTIKDGLDVHIANLDFGKIKDALDQAAIGIGARTKVMIDKIESKVSKSVVVISKSSEVSIKEAIVETASEMTIVFDDVHVELARAKAKFDKLNVSGMINLQGDGHCQLPTNCTDALSSADGIVSISGWVSLQGCMGSIALAIQKTSSEEPVAHIEKDNVFETFNNIIGEDGHILVEGTLRTQGLALQSKLMIKSSDASVQITGPSIAANDIALVEGALSIHSDGKVTFFKQLLDCSAESKIQYHVDVSFKELLKLANATHPVHGLIMNYELPTDKDVLDYKCQVEIVDKDGFVAPLESVNSEQANARRQQLLQGRHLLSVDAVAAKNTAEWTDDGKLAFNLEAQPADVEKHDDKFPLPAIIATVAGCAVVVGICIWYMIRIQSTKDERLPLID